MSDDQTEAVGTSLYFTDATILDRLDELAERTGLKRTAIMRKMIENELAAYEEEPAKLILQ